MGSTATEIIHSRVQEGQGHPGHRCSGHLGGIFVPHSVTVANHVLRMIDTKLMRIFS